MMLITFFRAAAILILASATAHSIKIVQSNVGGASFISTGPNNLAILNPPEENYIGVVLNGEQVEEIYGKCSRISKTLESISRAEEQELAELVLSISAKLDEPASETSGSTADEQKYLLITQTEPSLKQLIETAAAKPLALSTFGSPIQSDQFTFANHNIEVVNKEVSVSGGDLPSPLVRLLFIGGSLVKIYEDGKIEASQIECLEETERRVMEKLRLRLLETRDARSDCHRVRKELKKVESDKFQQKIADLSKKMNEDLIMVDRLYNDRVGEQISVSPETVKDENLKLNLGLSKEKVIEKFNLDYQLATSEFHQAIESIERHEISCLANA